MPGDCKYFRQEISRLCLILRLGGWKAAEMRPLAKRKSTVSIEETVLLWQRVKDSNPHIQSQSLLCYPYTNPLSLSAAANRYYYTEKKSFVKGFRKFFFRLFTIGGKWTQKDAKGPRSLEGSEAMWYTII